MEFVSCKRCERTGGSTLVAASTDACGYKLHVQQCGGGVDVESGGSGCASAMPLLNDFRRRWDFFPWLPLVLWASALDKYRVGLPRVRHGPQGWGKVVCVVCAQGKRERIKYLEFAGFLFAIRIFCSLFVLYFRPPSIVSHASLVQPYPPKAVCSLIEDNYPPLPAQ